jgi:plasmid stability protein
MTVNLSIKGVPDDVAARLRARAQRNRRSLQGELMVIIERAASDAEATAGARDAIAAPLAGVHVRRQGNKTIEQIAAEHRATYPEPFRGLPRSVDIIRADRDSR